MVQLFLIFTHMLFDWIRVLALEIERCGYHNVWNVDYIYGIGTAAHTCLVH